MNKFVTIGLAAAAVAVAAFLGYQLLVGPNVGGPPPEPSVIPSAEPSQRPVLFPVYPGPPQPVRAGIYELGPDFPVSISFVVPDGWLSCRNNAGLLCTADGRGGVNIFIVTNVVADPCDATTFRDPPVGPTVEDLVTAISSLPWSAVAPPADVAVDGFRGKEFEVTAPAISPCVGTDEFEMWVSDTGGATNLGPGERNRLRILDVDGTRIVIAGYYLPGTTSAQDLAEINAIIDSIQIE
jgi:hypothetical protein